MVPQHVQEAMLPSTFSQVERVQHPHGGRSSHSFPTRIGTLRRLIAASSQTTWEDNVSKKHAKVKHEQKALPKSQVVK